MHLHEVCETHHSISFYNAVVVICKGRKQRGTKNQVLTCALEPGFYAWHASELDPTNPMF
jgi:hypothetical protein